MNQSVIKRMFHRRHHKTSKVDHRTAVRQRTDVLVFKLLSAWIGQVVLYNSMLLYRTTWVGLLRPLLLVHQVGPLWKSPIALFGTLHLVSGMNFPWNYACLVTHSFPHFHLLLHMAVHHHHFLHHHHYLSLLQSFILNLRLGFLANPFHHRPLPYLSYWLHRLPDHFRLYFAQRLDLFT